MYLLDAGDVSDETWYGAGTASGLDLEAHFQIPISDMLYVRGMVDYRRVSMDFEQSGDVSYELEIGNITDSTIGGQLVARRAVLAEPPSHAPTRSAAMPASFAFRRVALSGGRGSDFPRCLPTVAICGVITQGDVRIPR